MTNILPRFFLFLLLTATLGGCAMAPLSNTHTARPLGKGGFSLEGGVVNEAPVGGRMAYGFTPSLDIGVEYETLAFGITAKYALLSEPKGASFAFLGGLGSSGNGRYYYGGSILSAKFGILEPFALLRYNHVRYNPSTFSFTLFGEEINETIEGGSYNYFNFAVGSSIWPIDWFGVALAANSLTSGVPGSESATYFTGSLLFRF